MPMISVQYAAPRSRAELPKEIERFIGGKLKTTTKAAA
jgi:hypothetical protein